ncbi:hypothetical protein ABH930_006383 [Kitasatospora sp. GAS204A]|uniref:hypothetical protein n=1 Tax=unclassified Kitasatospora TaxID=2633591 RepID=UPI002475ACBB|nr:hypothetical protein [Kitasatospora sp. GAS204B]MDH6122025.1 hypothetical protein [Kitasatospora sp. GAS204B]
MGATFYISADRQQNAAWPFTTEQFEQTVANLWPEGSVSTATADLRCVHVPVDDHWCEVLYDPENGVLSFPEREPWSAPLTVVHTLLRRLAPAVPAVWWADYDPLMEPLDLGLELGDFIAAFGS